MNNRDYHYKTSDVTQKVMDRILSENRWNLPEHKQESPVANPLRNIYLVFSILLLVGISISFIFINPSELVNPVTYRENSVTIIKSIEFVKSYSNLGFMSIQEGTIASIGEPNIYHPIDDSNNKVQTLIIFLILGVSMVTLLFNWLSREDKELNHT